jgi:hypothetical protein
MSSDHGNTTRNYIIYTAHSAAMRAARRTGKEPRRKATPTATFHLLQVKRSPTSGSISSRLSDSRCGTSAQELYTGETTLTAEPARQMIRNTKAISSSVLLEAPQARRH